MSQVEEVSVVVVFFLQASQSQWQSDSVMTDCVRLEQSVFSVNSLSTRSLSLLANDPSKISDKTVIVIFNKYTSQQSEMFL